MYGNSTVAPANGTLTMQNVVTVPRAGSSTTSVVGMPSRGAGAAAAADVDLVAAGAPLAEDLPLREALRKRDRATPGV